MATRTHRTDRGVRDLRAQREAAAVRDAEREKQQKVRDAEARKRAKEMLDAAKPVRAIQGFAYPSDELGQMRVIKKGEVFDPSDEAVQRSPQHFKEALIV